MDVVVVVVVIVVVGPLPYHSIGPFITSTSLDTLITKLENYDNYNWMGQILKHSNCPKCLQRWKCSQ